MITSIDRRRILPAFLRGAEHDFINALGVKNLTEGGIQRRFRLAGLFDAMYESLYFAQWHAVSIEARRPIRTVSEHLGFDLYVGPRDGQRVKLRYFPQVRNAHDKDYPLELASLHVSSFDNNIEDETNLYGIPAILSRCIVDKRAVLFEGKIPVGGRNYTTLTLHPKKDSEGGFSFRLE